MARTVITNGQRRKMEKGLAGCFERRGWTLPTSDLAAVMLEMLDAAGLAAQPHDHLVRLVRAGRLDEMAEELAQLGEDDLRHELEKIAADVLATPGATPAGVARLMMAVAKAARERDGV